MYRCQIFVAIFAVALSPSSVCLVDMTETYPSTSTCEPVASSFGPGFLLPNPGSPLVFNQQKKPEHEEYLGVQLLAHEFLGKAVISEAVSGRADEYGVLLQLHEDIVLFKPPVSGEVARELGSLVSQQLYFLRKDLAKS